VIRQLKVPLIKKPGQGLAINVLVKVDTPDMLCVQPKSAKGLTVC